MRSDGTGTESLSLVRIIEDLLILPAKLGPGVYSASNRNEYQELIK
jgi:hypothetical protein